MRYLGLDYGTKTVGLAVSDRTGFLASNYGVIRYSDTSEIFKELERIIKDEKIEAFVLGYPKNMNNTCGRRVEETLILKEELEKKFNLPVFLMDERLSTTEAEKVLLLGDTSRKKRKKVIDSVAATIILQTYLDMKGNSKNGE